MIFLKIAGVCFAFLLCGTLPLYIVFHRLTHSSPKERPIPKDLNEQESVQLDRMVRDWMDARSNT